MDSLAIAGALAEIGEWGVLVARCGRIETRHVLNAGTFEALKAGLRRNQRRT